MQDDDALDDDDEYAEFFDDRHLVRRHAGRPQPPGVGFSRLLALFERPACWSILVAGGWVLGAAGGAPIAEGALLVGTAALYVAFGARQRPVHAVHTAVLCAAAAISWWVLYGRLTPFPGVWEFVIGGPQMVASPMGSGPWWAAASAVALLLITSAAIEDSAGLARGAAAWTWFGLSVWTMYRGDYDGLWVLGIPPAGALAVAMVLVAAVVARLRRRVTAEHAPFAR